MGHNENKLLPKRLGVHETPILFKNRILERLSRTHPLVVVVTYTPIVAYMIWRGYMPVSTAIVTSIALFALGMCAWTLTEYWLHRAIMHCVPDFSWGKTFHFWAHEIHHRWPNDPYRLVMPLPISLSLFVLFFGLFYSIMGDYAWAFHAGFTLAYVMYDVIHYWLHHGKSTSRLFKSLQKHHLSHHFSARYDNLRFAVSVPLWDRIFGTNSPPNIATKHMRPYENSENEVGG